VARNVLAKLILLGLLVFPTALAAAEKVRVGFPSLATALSPSWVAVKQGLWKKYDLDVELIYLSGAITIPSLMSNSVQVVLGSDSEAVIGMLKGTDIVRLGVTTNSLGSSLVTRPGVSSFAQLKGRAIGIGSRGFSSLEVRLSQLLLENGINPDTEVKFLPIGGGPPARVAALEKEVIAAAMITPPYDFVAGRSGMKIFSRVDAPIIAGGINVMRPFLAKNRDVLTRFLKGYLDAIHFVLTRKEETVRIFGDYLNTRDKGVLERFYEEIAGRAEKDLRPDPKSVRFLLDFIGRRYPEARSIDENKFTDMSLVDDIRRSGFLRQLDK
jgi:ABC-type nitrate/sulfonate/bicarbonate transport system substrate-binding protein